MQCFKADMHIHTLLSPCADLSMSPIAIVERAVALGLDAIVACDHNSLHQLDELERQATSHNIKLFLGVEITTREEVHIVGILPSLLHCHAMQKYLDNHIKKLPYNPDLFGDQIWVDDREQIVGEVEWYLNAPIALSIENIVKSIHRFEGLAIAAHIDRPAFSIYSQLGFVPKGLPLDGVEYQQKARWQEMQQLQPELIKYRGYQASDAHCIEQIGERTSLLYMQSLNFEELKKAFKEQEGRYIV